jgi:hypothetical protein
LLGEHIDGAGLQVGQRGVGVFESWPEDALARIENAAEEVGDAVVGRVRPAPG